MILKGSPQQAANGTSRKHGVRCTSLSSACQPFAETSSGDVIAVYYAGLEADHTGIEWVRISV